MFTKRDDINVAPNMTEDVNRNVRAIFESNKGAGPSLSYFEFHFALTELYFLV